MASDDRYHPAKSDDAVVCLVLLILGRSPGLEKQQFLTDIQKLGLYKILYDPRSRRLLGLHVVAPNAGDVVQGFSLALRLEATVDDLAPMHHVFPTFGEGVKAAAEQTLAQVVELAEVDD